MKKFLSLIVLLVVIASCSEEKSIDYTAKNEAEIAKYIKDNNLTAEKTSSGLYYVITKKGAGVTRPSASSNVKVYYKGYFTNGNVFDKSDTSGVNFDLNRLVPGFSEGIRLLTKGGEATLIIPSRLAYGNRATGSIPAGAVLVFDVKLIEIN